MFNGDEYLLADSAYQPSRTIVPALKKLPRRPLTNKETAFNKVVANLRVCNEHCIGILKAKFQSLRELRCRIHNQQDAARCVQWIRACAVLHNFVLAEPTDETWFQPSNDDRNEISTGSERQHASEGARKREQLIEVVWAMSH